MSNDNARRPSVKPISRETPGAFSRLKSASNFAEIDRRVRLGWSSQDVANSIHEEFNELKDVSIKYLKKLVERYRSSLPPSELSLVSPTSLLGRNAAKRVAQGIDELGEIERLYEMQMRRIDIDVENERKINKLLPSTGHEIFVAMKLLKQSADLKMDLGLVKRDLGSMEITGQMAAEASVRYGRDSIGKVIADPDARRKVLAIAEKLLAIGARAGIDSIHVPDSADKPVIDAESSEVSAPTPAEEVK